MAAAFIPILLMLVSQTMSTQICLAPQSETVFYRTESMEDLFVAQDFEQGKIFHVFNSDNAQGESWSLVDLVNKMTYVNMAGMGCQYINHKEPVEERRGYDIFMQCLTDDAELKRSGLIDFYYMTRPAEGNSWLIGLLDVPDTEYKYIRFARLFATGGGGVAAVDQYRVAYKYSLGISDPTIFDKDLSACVPGELAK